MRMNYKYLRIEGPIRRLFNILIIYTEFTGTTEIFVSISSNKKKTFETTIQCWIHFYYARFVPSRKTFLE